MQLHGLRKGDAATSAPQAAAATTKHAAAKTAKHGAKEHGSKQHGAKKHGGVDLAKVHLKSFEEVERADLAGVEFTAAYAADEANVARMRSTVASVLLALSQGL